MSATTKGHRCTVVFADSTYMVLNEIAGRKGKSKGQVLRDAISLSKYFEDIKNEGGRILVERDGTTREIV